MKNKLLLFLFVKNFKCSFELLILNDFEVKESTHTHRIFIINKNHSIFYWVNFAIEKLLATELGHGDWMQALITKYGPGFSIRIFKLDWWW